MTFLMRLLVTTLSVGILAPEAGAQVQPVMSFLGGGVSRGGDDSEHRLRLGRPLDATERRHVWWLDAGVRLSTRLGVGGELALLEPLSGRFITREGTLREFDRERLLTAFGRFRVRHSGRLALDLVAGPAVRLGRYETAFDDGRGTIVSPPLDSRTLALAAGADGSLAVSRGVTLSGVVRLYRLPRDGNTDLTFQSSSTRLLIGLGVRFGG